ncbi:hypothetical protein, partial [Mesorhizobium sp.]|uniref:hypothetical protein n=1 Tax=Mesorhizobium sp. TaxID=1871066 RepID=UPI0025DA946E
MAADADAIRPCQRNASPGGDRAADRQIRGKPDGVGRGLCNHVARRSGRNDIVAFLRGVAGGDRIGWRRHDAERIVPGIDDFEIAVHGRHAEVGEAAGIGQSHDGAGVRPVELDSHARHRSVAQIVDAVPVEVAEHQQRCVHLAACEGIPCPPGIIVIRIAGTGHAADHGQAG